MGFLLSGEIINQEKHKGESDERVIGREQGSIGPMRSHEIWGHFGAGRGRNPATVSTGGQRHATTAGARGERADRGEQTGASNGCKRSVKACSRADAERFCGVWALLKLQ